MSSIASAFAGPGQHSAVRPRLRWLTPSCAAGGLLAGGAALLAFLGPYVVHINPAQADILANLQPPWFFGGSPAHILGTDQFGRDILARVLAGGRVSLVIAGIAVLVSGMIGVTAGAMGGYYGGTLDAAIMRLADVQLAFPTILLAISVVNGLGPSLTSVLAVLALSGWVVYARLVRSQVLALKHRSYVEAALAAGASHRRILWFHVLPNVSGSVVVVATFSAGQMLILEAALSFLGLGIQPPTPTWGGTLSEGLEYLTTAWWISTVAGAMLMAVILGVNLLGDWLRDLLDPQLQL